MATSVAAVKERLLKDGHQDFVIVGPDGPACAASGAFVDCAEKCRAAYAIVQQASSLLRQGEKLKRVTVRFAEDAFIASIIVIQGKSYGVVVQRPAPPLPPPSTATAP